MLENCNAIGAIVTCGGAGVLIGASVAAWCGALRRPRPMSDIERRRTALTIETARGRIALAADDLEGIPTPEDIRLAKGGLAFVAELLEDLERTTRAGVEA